jgi:AcrR family transcriptional regulator
MTQTQEIDHRNYLRDGRILAAAGRIIRARGLNALNRETIANEAGVSPTSVSNFGRTRITNGTHERLPYRTRILAGLMSQAIDDGDLKMIRVGIAEGCLKAHDVPPALRDQL